LVALRGKQARVPGAFLLANLVQREKSVPPFRRGGTGGTDECLRKGTLVPQPKVEKEMNVKDNHKTGRPENRLKGEHH